MKHLFRAGVLLVVLLIVFVVLRLIPVPDAWESFGFYRGGGDPEEWVNKPVQYIGSSVCNDCHENKYGVWEGSKHIAVDCETCHGPARLHVEEQAGMVINTAGEECGLCHAKLISRPGDFPQVDMVSMAGGEECITCHDSHDPRAGMPPEVSHVLEGREDCLVCHSQHEPWLMIPPEAPHELEEYTDCLSCHGSEEFKGAATPQIPHDLEGRADCFLCHSAGRVMPLPEDHVGRTADSCSNCHRSE